jgi:hypothetical protein
MQLVAGEAIVFPRGDAYHMASEPGVPPARGGAKLDAILARRRARSPTAAAVRRRGSSAATWRATRAWRGCS